MKKIQEGIIRNKYSFLLQIKQKQRRKQFRFSKQSYLDQKTSASLSSQISSQSDRKNKLLNKQIQLGTITSLPPMWVDKYEDCKLLLKDIDNISKLISSFHMKRMITMSDKEEIQYNKVIFEQNKLATQKTIQCQKMLKQIKCNISENCVDKKVCQNMCISLALDIQERANNLRKQQKLLIKQQSQIQNSCKVSFLEYNMPSDEIESNTQQLTTQLQVMQQKIRSKQINALVGSIYELNQIFKYMNNLVLIQGTLLDRIDINLDQGLQSVKKAKNQLILANRKQQNKCATKCIHIMIGLIITLGLIIILKYSR